MKEYGLTKENSMKNKKPLTVQERKEMYRELSNINSAKEARAYHKKYKKYGRGYGLPFYDRYPNFHLWCMGVSVILSLAAIVISSIAQL